jgi:anti-sigma-K factor RskA
MHRFPQGWGTGISVEHLLMERQELLDLIPAYALGALDADERIQVESFLKTDREAQDLLAEYQTITEGMVVMTPALRAPPHLQDDFRRRLQANRASGDVSTLQMPTPPRRLQPRVWIPVAAAAAILIVLAALLVWQNTRTPDPANLYNQLVAQAGARRIPIQAGQDTNGQPFPTHGELVISADGQQAVIRVQDLPPLTANQIYQLWVIGAQTPDVPESAGLMRFDNPAGPNYIPLPLDNKPASDYAGFALSLEPAGGSTAAVGPSGPAVFGVTLA